MKTSFIIRILAISIQVLSMKYAKTIILAAAILCVIAVAFFLQNGWDLQKTNISIPEITANNTPKSWLMFRGTQNLQGWIPGSLPEALDYRWKFKTGGPIISSPVIHNGVVIVGSLDEFIYTIDLQSGKEIWKYHTEDSIEATACVVRDKVFIGSADGFLYALDFSTGKVTWKYKTEGKILGSANWTFAPDGQSIWILVGSYDNKLHCVDSQSGKTVWTYETGSYINGAPAISEGKAVFGGCDAVIHVVSTTDGKEVTRIEAEEYIAGSAAIFEQKIYVGNYAGTFICADIDLGEIIWKYEDSESPYYCSPAVSDEFVVVGSRDENVYCFGNSEGSVRWKFKTLGEIDSSPVICGDKVIIGSSDGRLYMIDLSTGKKVWSYEIGESITSSAGIADGMVVIGCDDGYIYAFGVSK